MPSIRPSGIFSPELNSWIRKLADPRMKGKITYPLPVLLWQAILIFLLKMEARRQITWLLRPDSAAVLSHLAALTKLNLSELSTIACDDTVDNLFSRLLVEELQKIPQKMVRSLIRNRVLDHGRLLDTWYMVAIDATGLFSRRERHCPHCLVKTSSSGDVLYYHNVLEAKLVTRGGLALSIGSEPIENDGSEAMDTGAERYKQDCELKAFKRLAPRIKAMFPQLRICILCDSLYAAATIMDICKQYGWAFCISFKEGSIPSVYEEFNSLLPLQPENAKVWENDAVRQNISWVNNIEYRQHRLDVSRCVETNKKNGVQKRFVFITNIRATAATVGSIINDAGRQRWKIENQGFNTQKTGGYNLEHVYSENENAAKCFYLCLQIAHIINQLIEHGSLIEQAAKKFGSIKNLTRCLLDAIRFIVMLPADIEALFAKPFQIRLNSS